MLARLLFGGGLALVAAQLFAQGHVCGPGCSGATASSPDTPGYQEYAPMSPDLRQANPYQIEPNASLDLRSMMRSPNQFNPQQSWMDQSGMQYRGRANQEDRGRSYHGRGQQQGHGSRRDQMFVPQQNFDQSRLSESPQREMFPPSLQSSRQSPSAMFPRSTVEDYRPVPQPSLPPQIGGYRGASPSPMPPQRFRSRRQPMTDPGPPARVWNI